MIEVNRISKYFGTKKAVDSLSFTVKDGETLILLGTSGCGKTTTLKMINRLLEPDKGEILIDGENIKSRPPEMLRRNIGYVLQNIGLFPHYTVRQNIAIVPRLLHWDDDRIAQRAGVLMNKFNLDPAFYLDKYPDELSGGQQQRVGFVRALMANPPIILMDEPLGALDPITRRRIQKEFKELDELKGKTILMVTHDISEAIELGDRICLMNSGRIRQTGTAANLLLHPADEFVESFFADNRFTYQLRVIRIRDLFSYLSQVPCPDAQDNLIDPATDLLSMMERITGNNARNYISCDDATGLCYHFGREDLLNAFYKKISVEDIVDPD